MTKYTKEIKLAIYHEWVNDHRRGTYLSRKYGMERGGIQYIDYYNNVRIKTGRKNMIPIEYRNHVLTTLTA